MPRKKTSGYFVSGKFVVKGSELDLQFIREREQRPLSKTELKAQSTELQKIGVQLCDLPTDRLSQLELPTRLADALTELTTIRDFEGQRRQRQFVGKLMRKLSAGQIDAIRTLLEREREGSALGTQSFHRAEAWRDRLLADDAAMTEWKRDFPASDLPRLRTLVRQARKETDRTAAARESSRPDQTQRHGRSFRDLYQLVRSALEQQGAGDAF